MTEKQQTSELDVLVKKLSEINKTLQQDGRRLIMEAVQSVFKDNPELGVIAWSQHTPYFNDGDVCRFHLNEAFFAREGVVLSELEMGIEETEEWREKREKIINEFNSIEGDGERKAYCAKNGYEPSRWDDLGDLPAQCDPEDKDAYLLSISMDEPPSPAFRVGGDSINDFWGRLCDLTDWLPMIFGDPAQVVILRDGRMFVGEYDHD